jgi:hypothetical protein
LTNQRDDLQVDSARSTEEVLGDQCETGNSHAEGQASADNPDRVRPRYDFPRRLMRLKGHSSRLTVRKTQGIKLE